ncbi:3-hydroxyisobutyrate dehydrogenase [Ilumatobacter fluminis]|uniref:3-hydroxyisobutyrate dehydrogenase n=1 Tax=Ilumatobacter fluminis TaxID=467091 RepID=A0A4R7HWQ8_9ACTN|nr:NAD(P)-dependent oxidoreductase [Ilumatobacter fluminis]TDT14909.1 3-hydroxyisobutyrate dehydrogenase [Ilumatobacter fluminis]
MAHVAFIGLGVMGGPMAGHLVRAGHEVTVFNRTTEKADAWVAEFGHRRELTPAAASESADLVMMCVGNDNDVREVALGPEGVLSTMKDGAVLVDHTTASASVARELSDAATAASIGFVDAPVSGGQAGAEAGILTVMCGADDRSSFEAARPIIASYARECRLLGPSGAGQTTKMVNQICIAGLLQGLSEGIAFAQRAGLDVDEVVAVIGKGAAASWQMENRAATMAAREFDFGFAVEWMRKDLAICLTEADRLGARLPVTALVNQFYQDVLGAGGKRWDTSSLITRLDDR